MSKKPTVTTIASGFYSTPALNDNLTNIRDQFDNTLSLDGSTPNAMGADLDLNSNDILNGGVGNFSSLYLAGSQVVPTDTLFTFEGTWLTATAYQVNDVVIDSGSTYLCLVAHTSGTFATDLAASKWVELIDSTAYLRVANNLSDVASVTTSRTNLGLGTGDSPSFAGLTVDTDTLHVDSTNNRVGVGTASPAYTLDVEETGGATLRVHALSSGAGNDDDATLILDCTETGEAEILFHQDGVLKGLINWLSSGGPDLNISTSAGTAANIDFQPEGSLAMRIASTGEVLVGTTTLVGTSLSALDASFGTPPDAFPANNTSGDGSVINSAGRISTLCNNDCGLNVGRHSGVGTVAQWYYAGNIVGSVSVDASSTAYNLTSDYRLKEDVQPMMGASERIMGLNPVNFAWKVDGSRTDGFIAHEVQAIAPYAVTGEKDGEEMQQMDHSKLVPLLTAALQEALQRIEALEALVNVKTEG